MYLELTMGTVDVYAGIVLPCPPYRAIERYFLEVCDDKFCLTCEVSNFVTPLLIFHFVAQ